jgi:hypothetical protein
MSLAELISEPMTPGKVLKEAKTWLDWANWLTIQVLAYGEGKHFYYKEGLWRKWYVQKKSR